MAMREPTQDARAFQAYLDALRAAFLEREAVLEQLALALLAQEHVLITGPPGTAKSALAHEVLGGIVEEDGKPSLFTRQLTEGAVQTDLLGPVDFKVLTETGRTRHILEEGMLGHRYAFLDEVFDGRDMLLRAVLNALHERELKQGARVERGVLETAVLTSNRYLSEVVARVPELLLAFADRIPFQAFVPSAFARPGSRRALLLGATVARTSADCGAAAPGDPGQTPGAAPRGRGPGGDAGRAGAAGGHAPAWLRHGPLRASRAPGCSRSARWSGPCGRCGRRWCAMPVVRARALRATPEDLGALSLFFATAGPEGAELDAVLARTLDPREQAQLLRLRHEHRTFAEALRQTLGESRAALEGESKSLELGTLGGEAERLAAVSSPEAAIARAVPLLGAVRERLGRPLRAENRQVLLGVAARVVGTVEPMLERPRDAGGPPPPGRRSCPRSSRRRSSSAAAPTGGVAGAGRGRLTGAVPRGGADLHRCAAGEHRGGGRARWSRWPAGPDALDPEDAELNRARAGGVAPAAEALQLLLTGGGRGTR